MPAKKGSRVKARQTQRSEARQAARQAASTNWWRWSCSRAATGDAQAGATGVHAGPGCRRTLQGVFPERETKKREVRETLGEKECMAKCEVYKGLLLHVDAPVKQYIIDLDNKHNNAIILSHLHRDENKILVNPNFEDAAGYEQETVDWLQGRLDSHLQSISFKPDGVARGSG